MKAEHFTRSYHLIDCTLTFLCFNCFTFVLALRERRRERRGQLAKMFIYNSEQINIWYWLRTLVCSSKGSQTFERAHIDSLILANYHCQRCHVRTGGQWLIWRRNWKGAWHQIEAVLCVAVIEYRMHIYCLDIHVVVALSAINGLLSCEIVLGISSSSLKWQTVCPAGLVL